VADLIEPGSMIYDPTDLMGKMFFNIVATFAELEVEPAADTDPRRDGDRQGGRASSAARSTGNSDRSLASSPT
jgi:hypothetical protein